MKNRNFLIKPASALCDLACKYCFYADVSEHRNIKSHGVMKHATMKLLIDKALSETQSNITFSFQGGEPTLAKLSFYEAFIEYVNIHKNAQHHIYYALQTNGYTLDDAWCSFFYVNKFLIGVSLDGYKDNHDYFRVTKQNNLTFKRVLESIECLKKHHVEFNILTVLSAQLAKHPDKLYQFYKKRGYKYIQFIPCLSGLEEEGNDFSLTPPLFASFYKKFYDLWLIDYRNGDYMSVTLFDNIIPMFKGIPPQQCGMLGNCSSQFVVESNGNIYPCDFFVLDTYSAGNIHGCTLKEIEQNNRMSNFLEEKKKTSALCPKCEFEKICHGNCKRLNTTYFTDSYCGYQDFLKYAQKSMKEVARGLQ